MALRAWHGESLSSLRARDKSKSSLWCRHQLRLPSAEETDNIHRGRPGNWGTRLWFMRQSSWFKCPGNECQWLRGLSESWATNPCVSGRALNLQQPVLRVSKEVLSLVRPSRRKTSLSDTFPRARLWDAVQNLGLSCVALPGWARARLLFGTGWTGLIRNRPISFPSQLSRAQDKSLGLGLPRAAWRQIMLGLAVAGMGLHVCVTEKRFCWLTNCCLCNVFGN